jgi:hypothetical protein
MDLFNEFASSLEAARGTITTENSHVNYGVPANPVGIRREGVVPVKKTIIGVRGT